MSVAKCKTTRTHAVYGMHAAQCADGEIRLSGFEENESCQKYCHLPRMASLMASTYWDGTQYIQYRDSSVGPSWRAWDKREKTSLFLWIAGKGSGVSIWLFPKNLWHYFVLPVQSNCWRIHQLLPSCESWHPTLNLTLTLLVRTPDPLPAP